MAAAHTKFALPVQTAWTVLYAAAGSKSLTICNIGPCTIRVRCDAGAATGDDPDSVGYLLMHPGEKVTLAVVSGDDVVARPVGDIAGAASLLVI